MSKRLLGGIIGCKDKTSSWLNGFPDGSNIGSTKSCRGETHRYTVSTLRPTLMGTKNLYENGPNPFFLFGTKNLVRVKLMATVLLRHGFDN